jgi:hypothetical protein
MRESAAIRAAAPPVIARPAAQALRLLWRDKFALVAACYLALVALCALFGPTLLGEAANAMNLRMRNALPFTLERGGCTCSAPMRSAAASLPGSSWPRRTRSRSPPRRSRWR